MVRKSTFLFAFFGLALGAFFSSALLFGGSSMLLAANVNVSATVPGGGGGNPPPPPPPPGPTNVCGNSVIEPPFEQCDNGSFNSNTAPNACRLTCQNAGCGDSVIDTGEQCDNGASNSNTAPNACRLTCQTAHCGDNVVDTGEFCDDGNTTYAPGDACSSTCTQGLVITAQSVPAGQTTQTSAVVTWTTSIAGDSLLEWGAAQAAPVGCNFTLPSSTTNSASLVSHSLTANGLQPGTVYCYRISSASGALSDSEAGTFQTTGGQAEICNDRLDNDNDGFCDYPASSCTDGSTPGDTECSCSANFSCVPGACVNGIELVTCTDGNACQPNYSFQQSCSPLCQLTCSVGQQLNLITCTCQPIAPFCGNAVCETPTETPFNCPQDCPVQCLPDWQTGAWGPCVNGVQTRSVFDLNACGSTLGQPDTQQSCLPTCQITCGADETLDPVACTCNPITPFCGNGQCEAGESNASCPQDCVEPCTPNWSCLGWGACVGDVESRDCTDINGCGIDLGKPPTERSCLAGCEVACGTCQTINLNACSCDAVPQCCGNNQCEEGESAEVCALDCGLPPGTEVEVPECLDGKDNDGDSLVDFPDDPGCEGSADTNESNFAEVIENVREAVVDGFLDNPVVEQINETIAAPTLIALASLATVSTFSLANLASFARYLFTEPVAAVARRRRRKWGTVYNSLTKQPVDLAIVRMYRKDTGQLVQSRVTDKLGRYNFLVDPGEYTLTVTKPQFVFPSLYLKTKKEDVRYLDLYHGEVVRVTEKRAVVTANIPLDPAEQKEKAPRRLIAEYYLRKFQYGAAFMAIPLATLSMLISPNAFTLGLFCVHALLFGLFRRLGYERPPKSWGIVYDQGSKKPLARAITRIYDKQYNKLLETRITDGRGRYAFLVDNNVYYVTSERPGYAAVKTEEIDLVNKEREAIVALDIALKKAAATAPTLETTPTTTAPTQPQPGVTSDVVGRAALEEMLKTRQAATPAQPAAPAAAPQSVPPAQPQSPNPEIPKPQTPIAPKPPAPPKESIFG